MRQHYGYCVIAASEGIKNQNGKFLSEQGTVDAFGHAQLGGVAPTLANMIKSALGYKFHWAVPDYLQRSAPYCFSSRCGSSLCCRRSCVLAAKAGKNNIMITIERLTDTPYTWQIGEAPLAKVANFEKPCPVILLRKMVFILLQNAKRTFKA